MLNIALHHVRTNKRTKMLKKYARFNCTYEDGTYGCCLHYCLVHPESCFGQAHAINDKNDRPETSCTMVQSGDQGDEISINKGRLKRGGENLDWTLILLFLEQN